jgi:hypothetical protein
LILANYRHQQNLEGRLDHRDRQREYQRRRVSSALVGTFHSALSLHTFHGTLDYGQFLSFNLEGPINAIGKSA